MNRYFSSFQKFVGGRSPPEKFEGGTRPPRDRRLWLKAPQGLLLCMPSEEQVAEVKAILRDNPRFALPVIPVTEMPTSTDFP